MNIIFWAGDSTVAFNHIDSYPQTGIGQVFNLYLQEGFDVRDYAVNGRSTKSFIDEGRLERIEHEICEGDFLFIQFGHNDEKEQDPERFAAPFGDYQNNLRAFIEVARSHKAQPVLITPLERRHFDQKTGLIIPSHGEYPAAMIQVAEEEKVPCIDLNRSSRELMNSLGDDASKELFVHVPAGKYAAFPEGKSDNTHLQYHGAVIFAGLIAKELADSGLFRFIHDISE